MPAERQQVQGTAGVTRRWTAGTRRGLVANVGEGGQWNVDMGGTRKCSEQSEPCAAHVYPLSLVFFIALPSPAFAPGPVWLLMLREEREGPLISAKRKERRGDERKGGLSQADLADFS